MLYLIGLGLGDAKDITVKGLEVVRSAKEVYLEAYTSILTVGKDALLYNFGETVSIVFWEETWKPDSFYDKIASNRRNGLHTLCLLDIKVKEQSIANMMRGRKVFEPPRYMTVKKAAEQLLEILQNRTFKEKPCYEENTICTGLSRVGCEDQNIVCTTLKEMKDTDIGSPLHSLVVPGKLHFLEIEMLKLFTDNAQTLERLEIERKYSK